MLRVRLPARRRAGPAHVAALALAAACGADPPAAPGAERPSLLLVTLDTTRADRLSSYGHPARTTPQLDQLARDGALFTRAIAQAAVTPVSHASLFTGQNPYTHGLRVLHGMAENRLPEARITLAEVLRDAGYRTAAFVSAFTVSERFGLDQGFERYDAEIEAEGDPVGPDGSVHTGRSQRRADATTERALAWLRWARPPLFLWVHYFDPHDPALLPPREFLERFPAPPEQGRAQLSALYDLEIRFVDEQLGRLLRAFGAEALGPGVAVVTADHGEGLGDHGWWTHGILYEEQIRVPLVLAGPGVPAGRRIDALVRSIDVAPTLLELLGLDPSALLPAEGRSLVPLLRGEAPAPDPDRVAYSDAVNLATYHREHGIVDVRDDLLFAVTRGPWKYIHHFVRPHESELYHLPDDPAESRNLLASRPQQAARMRELLRRRDFLPREQPAAGALSLEELERLRELGYGQ